MSAVAKSICCLFVLFAGLFILSPPAWAEDSVCIQCHEGQEQRLAAPVGEWRSSIHAENGISCHDCHGGDPTDFGMAMSPERGFIGTPEYAKVPAFCGRCHVGVMDDYLLSAHGKAVNDGGAQCVICHGNHDVQKAGPGIINPEDCSRCHDYGRAGDIKSAVGETDRLLAGLETNLQTLAKLGIATKKMEGETFALRNDFHSVFHSVEIVKVRSETAAFQQRGNEIQHQIDSIHEELGERKLGGGIIAGLLFLASLICFMIRKTYKQDEDAKR